MLFLTYKKITYEKSKRHIKRQSVYFFRLQIRYKKYIYALRYFKDFKKILIRGFIAKRLVFGIKNNQILISY